MLESEAIKYEKDRKVNKHIFNSFLILSFTSIVFADDVMVPQEVETTLQNITKILLLIGTAVCIGKVIHIGILYLTSTAMEKSMAKQAVLPWIIGTIVCFGAATIGGAIIELFVNQVPSGPLDY